jgi:hypothetical protein
MVSPVKVTRLHRKARKGNYTVEAGSYLGLGGWKYAEVEFRKFLWGHQRH